MSQTKTQKFALIGPLEGKTLQVNGHEFVDGRYEVTASEQVIQGLTNLFSFYGAVPEEEAEAIRLGALLDGGDQVPVVGSATNDKAVVADQKPTLAEAIGLLQADNDAHWTSNNLPAIDFLEEATGKKVTRAEVEAVAEGFTRAKARALA